MHSDAFSLRTVRGRRVMVPIMLATMLNPLNSSLILTALVPIGNEFHAGPLQTGWLIAGLYLSSAVAQTPLGKCVDVLGARRTLLAGLAVAAVAAAMGALAPSLGWLIAARILLGFGTSAGFPAAMALLRRLGEDAAIPTGALSLVTIATQISTSVGPALSGVMVVLFGWRSTLAVNVPISLAALVMVLLWLPKDQLLKTSSYRAAGGVESSRRSTCPGSCSSRLRLPR
jgi:MFS family permease